MSVIELDLSVQCQRQNNFRILKRTADLTPPNPGAPRRASPRARPQGALADFSASC